MLAVPADTPQTTPVEEPTVTVAELLLHVPPGVPSVSVVHVPTHMLKVPDIADGLGFTVTGVVVKQPVDEIV